MNPPSSPEWLPLMDRLKREYPLVPVEVHRAFANHLREDWASADTLVTHPDMRVRLGVVASLGLINDSRSSSLLGRALHDSMAIIRHTAFELLGQRVAEEALPLFTTAFRSPDPGVRQETVAHIPRFGVHALPLLATALADPHPEVRIATVWALSKMTGEAPRPLLKSALTDDVYTVQAEARLALERLGQDDRRRSNR